MASKPEADCQTPVTVARGRSQRQITGHGRRCSRRKGQQFTTSSSSRGLASVLIRRGIREVKSSIIASRLIEGKSILTSHRYLIAQGLSFRGHDESSTSLNKGNFLEMIDWLKDSNEDVRVAFDSGGNNCKMTSREIQKDLARCCAQEVTEVIMGELGDKKFSILIDESRDISVKEQMAVMLRYVNEGKVMERFICLHHIIDTTSEALKLALLKILDHYNLSISRLRGQGYDGASNMRGEFNGLQRKILDENPHAFYIHCFAHRLQLVVVAVASSSCSYIHDFFEYVSLIVTATTSSCKKMEMLVEESHKDILKRLERGEISTGRGLHQQTSLARPGDTRWGLHHKTLLRLDQMWACVIKVLSTVDANGRNPSHAAGCIEKMECFKFALVLKLMMKLFAITNELSQLLQRKDTNVVLALELIHDVKLRLATMRDSGWESLKDEVQQFCNSKGIPVPNMDDEIPVRGRSRKEGRTITNLHYYRAEIFYVVIDKICVEMNHRFGDSNQEVIACFSCLDPKNSFSKFDVEKLSRLAEIYCADFSNSDRAVLRDQLETYVLHLRNHVAFSTCKDVESLARKMVETEKQLVFPLVYKLIELALLLPVSTASVERAFLAMKIITSKLRSTINDDWFNHLMICYTEREIFKSLDDDVITRRFQAMKARKGILPRHH
ncbi:zinc finger MYM-type protein 1-like [Hordeum vulgare subsp. vulgare]|uniref:zinc finger MYM-type protein 1-like n=1 Tax=Hordeum vulgare subsp. vulgare TaxID=112509 RepID=UPI001D1A5025|nr:zinc finger MYM-type protein 1-like [Hordeum vulgare subsp. vulgare]